MRRPGAIIRSLFTRDQSSRRGAEPFSPTPKAHDLPPIITDARAEVKRKGNLQMVHDTKPHPGAKKTRNRARNKQARASRKRNRHAYRG